MPIKIIVQGTLPAARVCRGACAYCQTQVEYTADDAKRVCDPRDGDHFVVKCPTCGYDIYGRLAK